MDYEKLVLLLRALEDSDSADATAVADPYDVRAAWSVARVACEAREFIEAQQQTLLSRDLADDKGK